MISNSPRVTLAMPIYNGEAYLADTLQTILGQTFTDFELLISDNASTDNTQALCQTFAAQDSRIAYTRQPQNLGAAPNFNGSIPLARGEYFKWVAYDDPLAPTLLEKCVATLDNAPEAIMAYGRTILIDGDGRLIENHHDGFDLRSPRPHQRFHQSFRASAWCHPVFGLIRTAVLRRSGQIGSFASSDKVLLGELALLGQCHEVPEHLAYRRLHPQNSTTANRTDESMAAWFDTAVRRRKNFLTPRWRRFLEHAKSIHRAQLPPADFVACYGELLRFYFSPQRLQGVAKELRQVGRDITQKR